MTELGAWKTAIWEELSTLDPEEQFVVAGEWITYITRNLLPELGLCRRENVISLVDNEGMTNAEVAGKLSMRRSTIIRLIDEGRSVHKQQREAAKAAESVSEMATEPAESVGVGD